MKKTPQSIGALMGSRFMSEKSPAYIWPRWLQRLANQMQYVAKFTFIERGDAEKSGREISPSTYEGAEMSHDFKQGREWKPDAGGKPLVLFLLSPLRGSTDTFKASAAEEKKTLCRCRRQN